MKLEVSKLLRISMKWAYKLVKGQDDPEPIFCCFVIFSFASQIRYVNATLTVWFVYTFLFLKKEMTKTEPRG